MPVKKNSDNGGAAGTLTGSSPPRRENLWISLGCNIAAPLIILKQGDKVLPASPEIILAVALLFPLGYGLRDFIKLKKYNFVSIIGFVSVLLTGGIGLLELPVKWFIFKEAAVPAAIGLAVLVTLKTRYPLVKVLLYNPAVFDVAQIEARLRERGSRADFDRLLGRCTLWLAGSFFMSSVLNYFVARHFIRTEPALNKPQFNHEVADMLLWSQLIIVVPSMVVMFFILWRFLHGIRGLAGLEMEQALLAEPRREKTG